MASPVVFEIRETIWGPVDETADYPDGEIAVSWIAHDPEALNLEHARTRDGHDSRRGARYREHDGHAAAEFRGRRRRRQHRLDDRRTDSGKNRLRRAVCRPTGASSTAGWAGCIPTSTRASSIRPDGRIWTANARVADGAALETIGDGGYDLGARARQIRDGLEAQGALFGPRTCSRSSTTTARCFSAAGKG